MPKGMLLVQSRPADPAREDEFNDWYANTHIPEVCAVPGIVGARRYKVHEPGPDGDDAGPVYIAIYEIDTRRPRGADARARGPGRATGGCA